MAVTRQRYTLADLFAMTQDDQLYDIQGGGLVVFSAPDNNHAELVNVLIEFLALARRAGYGRWYTAPRAVAFDYRQRREQAEDVTHPDVFFVRRERLGILGRRCVEAAPDLVIEVLSPTTRAQDLPGGHKWQIYERHGVAYYWIVDPDARLVRCYEHRDGRFRGPTMLQPGDTLACPLFPSITLELDQLFADVL